MVVYSLVFEVCGWFSKSEEKLWDGISLQEARKKCFPLD